MNQEKCGRLEAIGFVWEPLPQRSKNETKKRAVTPFEEWVDMFKKYREENDGDPNITKRIPRLGSWVVQQRKLYKLC